MSHDKCYAPVFEAKSAAACVLEGVFIVLRMALIALSYLVVVLVAALTGQGKEIVASLRCAFRQDAFRLRNCRTGNGNPRIDLNFELDHWLAEHPAIRDAIAWEQHDHSMLPYPQWSPAQKADLAAMCARVEPGKPIGLPPIPDVPNLNSDGTVGGTELSDALAWDYFLGYVAHSIVAEAQSWFPWSIAGHGGEALEALFDSRSLLTVQFRPPQYIVGAHNPFLVVPIDPGATLALAQGAGLIGPTPLDSIHRVLEWCRKNMSHYNEPLTPDGFYQHWQVRGLPPFDRIFNGTTHTAPVNSFGFSHWTTGCRGTSTFIALLLRTANVPVKPTGRGAHYLPHFVVEDLFLSHADDLYSTPFREWMTFVPVSELLIDRAKFDKWFGPNLTPAQQDRNVGRQVADLTITYLPHGLLRVHCTDMAYGNDHAASDVVRFYLGLFYSVAELEAIGLWTRMDAKIAGLGGCDKIPP